MKKKNTQNVPITDFEGCQLPCVPKFALTVAHNPSNSVYLNFKRLVAYPWNYYIKKWIKKIYYSFIHLKGSSSYQIAAKSFTPETILKTGDLVRVRSIEEISRTLDPFRELKGCSFLHEMHQYCGTEQKVFRSMHHFLDERDYKLKKTRGLILLENVFCNGTPVFGKCDRCCFLFWREEWLEKIK